VAGRGTCPRCRVPIFLRDAPDLVIGECGQCCGIWLGNRGCQLLLSGELSEKARETIRIIDAQVGASAERAAGYRTPATAGSAEPLSCPICGAPLTTHITDEARQGVRVRLDICASHGTWFDRGEAWTLMRAVELERLALDVELETAARERAWDDRERAWNSFVAGAAAGAFAGALRSGRS